MRMDRAEWFAKHLFEHVLTGSRMIYRRCQSRGEYDFDLVYPDCRKAAVEVTMTIDEDLQRTWSRILDKRKGIIRANCCKRSWYITISSSPDTRIDRIRREVGKYLADIEKAGITEFREMIDSNEHVGRIRADLGVVYGTALPDWVTPARVEIGLPGPTGKLTDSAAVDAVESAATKEDNIKKLRASMCEERHLAVYAPPHSLASFDLWMHEPPPRRANLPSGIDHLWIFGEELAADVAAGCDVVVWHADSENRWLKAKCHLQLGAN